MLEIRAQIEAGPLIAALKWTGFALLAGALAYGAGSRWRG
jgi:hypothetical protein